MRSVETIENRWDILYRDYPDVYEEFVSVRADTDVTSVVIEEFGLTGIEVADVGCGTGKSAFRLAKYASKVVGIEPEQAMLDLARELLERKNLANVELVHGSAQKIPLPDKSVDAVTAFTTTFYPAAEMLPPFISESQRVLRTGGKVILVNVAPGWYGGDLHDVIGHGATDRLIDEILIDSGFDYRDIDYIQDYGSVEKMVRTYGFIFGHAAIDYIKHNRKTRLFGRNRIRFKTINCSDLQSSS